MISTGSKAWLRHPIGVASCVTRICHKGVLSVIRCSFCSVGAEMSLSLWTPHNWVWNGLGLSTNTFAVLSVACAGGTELTPAIFCPNSFLHFGSPCHQMSNFHYPLFEHFLQINHNLRTINDQINISNEKPRKLEDTLAKLFQTMRNRPVA